MKPNPDTTADPDAQQKWLDLVRKRVTTLRFGVVQIIVHDGRVTQIESTERVRLPAGSAGQD